MNLMFAPILVPAIAALIVLFVRQKGVQAAIACVATLANLVLAALLFAGVRESKDGLTATMPWAGDVVLGLSSGGHPLFVLGNFGAFILLAAAFFAFLVALYSWKFMEKHPQAGVFYVLMLLTTAMAGGAVMADHLIVLLFFWEGMLGTMFGMIALGQGNGPGAWKTATKALLIAGTCDLCMILGIILVGVWGDGHTLLLSQLMEHPMKAEGMGALAFIMLMIGATAKAGSMPFHTWIPDAATDAPLPFMAFLPASLEKLLGIYFLSRITLDIFHLEGGGPLSMVLMIMGAATILLAVAMALVQKDYKRLLSYHAISQVGYMVLGVGTGNVFGIVGGLFHMVNNGLYKSCLFMTAGNVEKQTGTTDLRKLGGLASKMPITWVCYAIAALSISGFPLTNGFYSKELVYEGALERGWFFYAAAALGTVLTAASFLKLGHAVFLGKRDAAHEKVTEAPLAMYLPTVILAVLCLVFGLMNFLPIKQLIEPAVANYEVEGRLLSSYHTCAKFLPTDGTGWFLAGMTVVALAIAFVNHLYGVKKTGKGVGAVDHIHHAPVLSTIYDRAAAGWFDPYKWAMALATVVGHVGNAVNIVIDFFCESFMVAVTQLLSWMVRRANTGNYAMYVLWSLAGTVVLIWYLLR